MQKGFYTLVLLIICNFVYSQTKSITQIESIVSNIDTSTYKQKTIEGTVTTKPSKNKGSSTETYYVDTVSKRLIKVEFAEALYDKKKHLTYVELITFYYNSDKLIMVKSSRFDTFGYPSFKKALSSGTYYYSDNTLILSKETGYKHGGIGYISKAETYRDIMFKKVFSAD